MKIICAPDSFKESLTAVEAAEAMAAGVVSALPDAVIDLCPAGDGGEGTLETLLAARSGKLLNVKCHGANGADATGACGLFDNGALAYVESASAIGLATIPAKARDVKAASSFGVGEILRAAAAKDAESIIVGIGGSATNDGGCGMAQALGVRFLDASGKLIPERIPGSELARIAAIDISQRETIPARLLVACDVENPLTGAQGASRIYGPQKGASEDDVELLEAGMQNLAELIRRDLGLDVENMPGAGAAGGLGAGLVAFAGAELRSGVQVVLDAIQFAERVRDADLCLTGEGRLDQQSLSGKTCVGVAEMAAQAGVPVIALVGTAGPGAERSIAAGISEYVAIGDGLPLETAMQNAAALLTEAAARIAGRYR